MVALPRMSAVKAAPFFLSFSSPGRALIESVPIIKFSAKCRTESLIHFRPISVLLPRSALCRAVSKNAGKVRFSLRR